MPPYLVKWSCVVLPVIGCSFRCRLMQLERFASTTFCQSYMVSDVYGPGLLFCLEKSRKKPCWSLIRSSYSVRDSFEDLETSHEDHLYLCCNLRTYSDITLNFPPLDIPSHNLTTLGTIWMGIDAQLVATTFLDVLVEQSHVEATHVQNCWFRNVVQ